LPKAGGLDDAFHIEVDKASGRGGGGRRTGKPGPGGPKGPPGRFDRLPGVGSGFGGRDCSVKAGICQGGKTIPWPVRPPKTKCAASLRLLFGSLQGAEAGGLRVMVAAIACRGIFICQAHKKPSGHSLGEEDRGANISD
jgi:hypothetical protein